jgi:hypothetical protein
MGSGLGICDPSVKCPPSVTDSAASIPQLRDVIRKFFFEREPAQVWSHTPTIQSFHRLAAGPWMCALVATAQRV